MDCDIAIVGAGPVGLTSALLLRDLGHEVQILERHAEHYKQPRAVGIFHQGVRAFAALGLLDELFRTKAFESIRPRVSDFAEVVNGEGEILSRGQFNAAESKSGTEMSFAMHQPTLETVLEKACHDRGIVIRRGIEVIEAKNADNHVELDICNVLGAERKLEPAGTVTAHFVIGCDGANSIVRKSAGIPFHACPGPESRWLVVDVIPKGPGISDQWKDSGVPRQYLDFRRPRTSVPSPATRRRWEFMVHASESSEQATSDAFIWPLLEEFGCSPRNATIERRTVYTLKGGWAERFVQGRIALAGDAAHLAPQFLGQGLNSGLRDAKALCWRLSFALRHAGADWRKVLEDYSTEQLGTTQVFVTAALDLEKFYTITDPGEAKARDEVFKGERPPMPNLEKLGAPGMYIKDQKLEYNPSGEPGCLFMHAPVVLRGKKGFFDSVVGTGWVLLGRGHDSPAIKLSPTVAQNFLEVLGGISATFNDANCKDITTRYSDWFSTNGAEAVLVRPDYYIFGVAKIREDINGLVQAAIDRLMG